MKTHFFIFYTFISVQMVCVGPVKKCVLLKIVHEKYRPTGTKRPPPQEVREFQQVVQDVAEQNRELQPFVSKAQDNLNPLRVLQLFERIPDEVKKNFLHRSAEIQC